MSESVVPPGATIVRIDLPLVEEEGGFQCPLCEKCYIRAPGLRTHVAERHRDRAVFRYQCRRCDAILGDTTRRLMETHMRVCPRRHRVPRPNEVEEAEVPPVPEDDDHVAAAVHDLVTGIRRNLFPSPDHVPASPPPIDISPGIEMAARRLEELLDSPGREDPPGGITPPPLPAALPLSAIRTAMDRQTGDRRLPDVRPGVGNGEGEVPAEEDGARNVPWDHDLRRHVDQDFVPAGPQRVRSAVYRRGGNGRSHGPQRRRNERPVNRPQQHRANDQPDPPPVINGEQARTAAPRIDPASPSISPPRPAPNPVSPDAIPAWNLENGHLDMARRRPARGNEDRRGGGRGTRRGAARGAGRPRPPGRDGPGRAERDQDDDGEGLPDRNGPELTPQQQQWLAELNAVEDFDLEVVSDVARRLAAAAAVRVEPGQGPGARPDGAPHRGDQRPYRRRPPPARPAYDAAAASALQKLYRVDRKKAINNILGGPNPHCEIDPDTIRRHLEEVFAGTEHVFSDPPESVPNITFPSSNDETSALMARITPAQVVSRLARMACTAPGPDGARYSGLKRTDPGGHVMAAVFTKCLHSGQVPPEWKLTTTVLIYKAGDRADPSNWRPLSLGNTIGKLYAAILADRITEWAEEGGRLSPQQKGFTSHDGCLEHNFIAQTSIDDARRDGKEICMAWLDLANAFPSVPHAHLFGVLDVMGMPPELLTVIRDLYTNATTRVMTAAGLSDPIPIRAGVKQGCPLSPIIFNIGMEPLIRSVTAMRHGYRLGPERVSLLAFADDVMLLAENEIALQSQLDTACEVAEWSGLQFKPGKCASLHIGPGRGGNRIQPTEFSVDESPITTLADGEHYRHLGVPTGFRTRQTPVETIRQFSEDLKKLDESLLAPWQKVDATATFLLPRMDFIMRGADVRMEPLRDLDRQLKRLAKGWLNLPQRASAEPIYLAASQGGAGRLHHVGGAGLPPPDLPGPAGPTDCVVVAAEGGEPQDWTASDERGPGRVPQRHLRGRRRGHLVYLVPCPSFHQGAQEGRTDRLVVERDAEGAPSACAKAGERAGSYPSPSSGPTSSLPPPPDSRPVCLPPPTTRQAGPGQSI